MRKFYPEKQLLYTEKWIQDYFTDNGDSKTKAVIGISGGKDSTIAAALLVRALGPERVVAVLMPCGEQSDISDSYEVCTCLKIPKENIYEINIKEAAEALYNQIPNSTNPQIRTNTPARLRMTVLYAIAANVHGRVCNTGNRSEKYVGYTTKYGDNAGDFALLQNLTVSDLLELGPLLPEIPARLISKTPADGMSGKTDEDNMGFSYADVDDYILYNIYPKTEILYEIKHRNLCNQHKNTVTLSAPPRLTKEEE